MTDIESTAKWMRERALLIEGDESLQETLALNQKNVESAKNRKQKKLENFRKLYFNAGRWVGGARDQVARNAFIQMNELENRHAAN